jgi:hypothetical protein
MIYLENDVINILLYKPNELNHQELIVQCK